MFFPEIDNKAETIKRADELLTRLGVDFKLEFNSIREIRYRVTCKDVSTNNLYVVCNYDDRRTGIYLVQYTITTDFCKGIYKSGPCVNGRVPVTCLLQDLEDAINRKAEDWKA